MLNFREYIIQNYMNHPRRAITKLIRNDLNPYYSSRKPFCIHAGKVNPHAPKPHVQDTDISGHHEVLVKTECGLPLCKTINCADTSNPNVNCPGRTAQENQTSIPPTSQGFTTKIIGNGTSVIPKGKKGFTVNSKKNYSGQPKAQLAVKEHVPPEIDSNDFNVNPQSTTFVQTHTNVIEKNIP